MVSGHTLVITSRLIFSHVFSLPSALDVRTKEVMKKAAVSTEERIRGRLRLMVDPVDPADPADPVDVFADVLLELILFITIFICSPV